MASDWDAGERQGDNERDLDPVERSEAETLTNVCDCNSNMEQL